LKIWRASETGKGRSRYRTVEVMKSIIGRRVSIRREKPPLGVKPREIFDSRSAYRHLEGEEPEFQGAAEWEDYAIIREVGVGYSNTFLSSKRRASAAGVAFPKR
jgi:hypothetical protein